MSGRAARRARARKAWQRRMVQAWEERLTRVLVGPLFDKPFVQVAAARLVGMELMLEVEFRAAEGPP